MTEKIPVDVPESITDKMLSLVVGGGASINALEFRFSALGGTARDSQQLVHALNRMRRNNRVYALLMAPQRSFVMQGDEYPSPPPSLVQTFMADSAAASSVIFSGTSVVGDFETTPTPYAIHGQKTLILKVAGRECNRRQGCSWWYTERGARRPGRKAVVRTNMRSTDSSVEPAISPSRPADHCRSSERFGNETRQIPLHAVRCYGLLAHRPLVSKQPSGRSAPLMNSFRGPLPDSR